MADETKRIDILPEDEEASRRILDRLYDEKIADADAVTVMVEQSKFSSPEAAAHVAKSIRCLFLAGVFNQPRPATIDLGQIIDTDARDHLKQTPNTCRQSMKCAE